MKHVFIFLIAGFLSLYSTCAFAQQPGGGNDPIEIIIVDEHGSTEGSPIIHAPALIPIQATCYLTLNTIMVNFLYDLGSVGVEIENQTAGTCSQMTVNATQGVHPFLISGNAGHWTITFTISSGVVYYGEFDIIY